MKKRYLLIALGVLLVFIMGWQIYRIFEQRNVLFEEIEEVDIIRSEEEQELARTYIRLRYAFLPLDHLEELEEYWNERIENGRDQGIAEWRIEEMERIREMEVERVYYWSGKYIPLNLNSYGINVFAYLNLRFYYRETGVYLPWSIVKDYFSEEFEQAGERRLYNNGRHPEIEDFVTWMWEERKGGGGRSSGGAGIVGEAVEYQDEIERIYTVYFFENRDNGFETRSLTEFSPQMLDALARAEADPDYELDLTSLQEAGY